MRLIRGQTSISVPKNNFRFSGKPRQPTPRQDQNRPHVQFPQSAHTESKELAPTFLRREVASRLPRAPARPRARPGAVRAAFDRKRETKAVSEPRPTK